MTIVKVKKNSGHIVSVEALGHTGFGIEGEDIVCAALSSVVQTALLGIISVVGLNIKFDRNDEEGFLKFDLPDSIDKRERHDADVILETMLCFISHA